MFLYTGIFQPAMDAIIYSLSIWALDGVLGFRRAFKQILREKPKLEARGSNAKY